jgi:hypothetical protein
VRASPAAPILTLEPCIHVDPGLAHAAASATLHMLACKDIKSQARRDATSCQVNDSVFRPLATLVHPNLARAQSLITEPQRSKQTNLQLGVLPSSLRTSTVEFRRSQPRTLRSSIRISSRSPDHGAAKVQANQPAAGGSPFGDLGLPSWSLDAPSHDFPSASECNVSMRAWLCGERESRAVVLWCCCALFDVT